ncbi:MAG: glycosyltransferase family 2 protein [Acidobacteriota bacterium]|nr:glycosyltransferase family 2 protein [Acidobacteriota bacterium]
MITAIVPVCNGREYLRRLLDSLEAQSLRAEEVLAIDNGSSDGAPEAARERGARVIPMGRNAGFAAAVNRGIREARGEWLAILNSDVELAPDYFERLVASGAPFATGCLRSPRGTLDGTFDLTTRAGTTWRAGAGMAEGAPFDRVREIESPPFTAVLARAEVFVRAGLLEERFESYLEDAEFGMRCARLGIRGRYVPEARAVHLGSATLGRWHPETVRRIARNQLFLAARHLPRACWWNVLIGQLLWGGVALRHGRGLAWLRGKREGLRGFRFAADAPCAVEEALRANERFIRETAHDRYWRLYFLLTRGTK